MIKEKLPSFQFLRIFFLSILLYYMLVGPINSYMMVKNLPSLISSGMVDSNIMTIDTSHHANTNKPDSVLTEKKHSTHYVAPTGTDLTFKIENDRDFNISSDADYSILLYLIPFLASLFFNIPFKQYFNRKRKNKIIKPGLEAYVKKYLLKSPLINALLIFLTFLIGIINHTIAVISISGQKATETDLYNSILIISIISSILITFFAYFWHRHRVRHKYIEHIFTAEEIDEKLSKAKDPQVKAQLLMIHGITTLLPLSVIVFYIFISLSTPAEIGLKTLNPDHMKILMGRYTELVPESMLVDDSFKFLIDSFYINSFDAFLASLGILSSFLVAIIYVILMTRWFTTQITKPLNSLLSQMEATAKNKEYAPVLIRTNDEFGKLTSGYNLMSDKIRTYIEEIKEMNRNLEQKVVERTLEIQSQKDEIEAQRDEIEAQRDEIQAQRDTVMKQKEHIEYIHEEQTSSIRYAQRIQQDMLPALETLKELNLDFFVLFNPRDIVSGDFYWTRHHENTLILVVADCTGHGVPGAFMSMLGITYLKQIIVNEKITQPDKILNLLRDEIIRSLKQSTYTNQRDGMDIAICTINLDTLELQFSGANNPLYIIKAAATAAVSSEMPLPTDTAAIDPQYFPLIELKGDKMPIAIHERMDPFTVHSYKLEKGDCLYLFSDGYADQFGGAGGKKFKYKQLKELLTENSICPITKQKELLEKAFVEWKGNLEQVDDITIMGIKI